MPLFAVFSRLTERGMERLLERPERVLEVNRELEDMGVKVVHQYVMLGEYDFLNIVEAESEHVLLKALVNLNKRGTVRTTTYRIIPVGEFLESLS